MVECRIEGWSKVLYCGNRVIGKTKIASQFKVGARQLSLSDPDRFTGHALKSVYVGKIVNNPNIDAKESQLATRHESVPAQLPYIEQSDFSEVQKLKALGIEIPENEKKLAAKSPIKEEKII